MDTRPIKFKLRFLIPLVLLISVLATVISQHQRQSPAKTPLNPTTQSYTKTSSAVITKTRPMGWQRYWLKAHENFSQLWFKLGLTKIELQQLLKLPLAHHYLNRLTQKHSILFGFDAGGLNQIQLPITLRKTLIIYKSKHHFAEKITETPLETYNTYSQGIIKHNLNETIRTMGLPISYAREIRKIFADKINFMRDLHKGDHIEILYQRYFSNGVNVGFGHIAAILFNLHGHKFSAIRFTDPKGKVSYYSAKGHSLKRAFLRYPIHFRRISSTFSLHRWHPILKRWRAHLGVDLAAPRGTPVHAAADGRIKYIGRDGGYGRLIILKNGPKYSTRYAHLSRFAKHMRRNKWVKRGQIIAYVGSSGLATGPHLHYEVRVFGVPRNPLKVKLPYTHSVPRKYRHAFRQLSQRYITQLALHSSHKRMIG